MATESHYDHQRIETDIYEIRVFKENDTARNVVLFVFGEKGEVCTDLDIVEKKFRLFGKWELLVDGLKELFAELGLVAG